MRKIFASRALDPVLSIRRYFSCLDWSLHYRFQNLAGDAIAGSIVAIMLVPQSMAYALLAGLPPQAVLCLGVSDYSSPKL